MAEDIRKEEPQTKEEEPKKKKTVGTILEVFLGFLIAFMLSCQIQMMVTQDKNHGVPRAYGLSFLYVATDSMEGDNPDSLHAGTGIVIQKTDPSKIKLGDVVTFWYEAIGACDTHRIDREPYIGETDGLYHFHTMGDNAASQHYTVSGESFTENELIGRVIAHSDAFGKFLTWVSPSASGMASAVAGQDSASNWLFPVLMIVPIVGICAITAIDMVKDAKKEERAQQALIEEAMDKAGIDRNDEAAVTMFEQKERFKIEYREKMTKELEKEKAKLRKKMGK